MCSSAPSLDYDSRKQVMFSISSLVTVWTNWNRTQNSICAVLGPATTSRLLSSAFFYSFFLCMANKTPLVTNTHQAGEPEKVPLHRQRCSLCVFGWIWRSWDQIWIFPCRYRSRCILTSWGKRKSDRIVKPWERVIQITEIVEVFARKTNLRELENWKFDLQRKRDIFIFSRTTPDFHDFTLSLQLFPSLPYVATLQTKSRRPFLPKTRRRWPSSLAVSC